VASSTSRSAPDLDQLLKSLMLLSRITDQVLETLAVQTAVKGPLSTSKVRILRLLGTRGTKTATQAARFLAVSKPAVTQIADALIRARLLSRRTAKKDRREVELQLTKEGRKAFQAIHRRQRELVRLTITRSGDRNAGRWAETLSIIANALSKADETFHHFCLQCEAHADGRCILNGDAVECPYLMHGPSEGASANGGRKRRRSGQAG